MCGIIGIIGRNNADELVKTGLKSMEKRGQDGIGIQKISQGVLGHCLHAVVGGVKQPIVRKGVMVANCEIYNWKKLNEKYKLKAKNDAELLCLLLDQKGIEMIEELDGVYAFAYYDGKYVFLARDIIGVKPMWLSYSDGLCFASEKKALEKIGIVNSIELNPRKIIKYNLLNRTYKIFEREFFSLGKFRPDKKKVMNLLETAVKKRIPDQKIGLLFSGGVDSSYLALILKKLGVDFTCYVAGVDSKTLQESEDVIYAKKAAEIMGLELKVVLVKEKDVVKYLHKVVPLIEDTNVVKVGVALPFYAACEQAKKDGCKVIMSGLGSEEIFAGYQRHKDSQDVNKECVSGLLKMYERDLYRDDVVTMHNGLELRVPFLDIELVNYCLKIPPEFKLKDGMTKMILRECALEAGMPKEIAMRKKRAAQYGSNFHKVLKKLSGKKRISEYLRQFYPQHNLKLGALVSSGKDSVYAMYTMLKMNYEITCMIALKSKNPDSYMFHTPGVEIVKLQSESTGIPVLELDTKGKKEKELEDLKKALIQAKEKYDIQGVVTGALYSNYQRERIEKIADSLELKIYSPLWHVDQEVYVRELIERGFKFVMTKVMAEGLDKNWLGKEISLADVDKLKKLHDKIGFHIAGEGGEYESLMIDGPIFEKKINIVESEIKEEGIVGELIIKRAELTSKK